MQRPDLALLPKITHGHAWFSLDARITSWLGRLPRTVERLQNSVRFMWFSAGDTRTMNCGEEEAGRLREGFLRAALAELVSVEEVLRIDLGLGQSDRVLKMNATELPLLHLVRELRNHELHLHHNRLAKFSRDLLLGDMSKPEESSPITVSMWVLDGVTVESVHKLNNGRRYSNDELRAMVEWFNQTQSEWGVHEVLLKAARDYAERLCLEYAPSGFTDPA